MHILRNIVFFVLLFIAGFFTGILVAILVDAGKDQMLAGGAIVLGYGLVGAFIGILLAIFVLIKYRKKALLIKKVNVALLILALGLCGYFWIQHKTREAAMNGSIGMDIHYIKPFSIQHLSSFKG